jgi:hypothetical protein
VNNNYCTTSGHIFNFEMDATTSRVKIAELRAADRNAASLNASANDYEQLVNNLELDVEGITLTVGDAECAAEYAHYFMVQNPTQANIDDCVYWAFHFAGVCDAADSPLTAAITTVGNTNVALDALIAQANAF